MRILFLRGIFYVILARGRITCRMSLMVCPASISLNYLQSIKSGIGEKEERGLKVR
jgi:hypothetical protein